MASERIVYNTEVLDLRETSGFLWATATWMRYNFQDYYVLPLSYVDDVPIEVRRRHEGFRAGYALFRWHYQQSIRVPMLPNCTWCGMPTGNFCDAPGCGLTNEGGLQKAICTFCEDTDGIIWCRPCSGQGYH